jgi:hypothetical protein
LTMFESTKLQVIRPFKKSDAIAVRVACGW